VKKAFTLVELLIVVIIIGILATIAVPQYGKMVKKAELAGVWTTLGAARRAIQLYRIEHGVAPLVAGQDWKELSATGTYQLETVDLPFDEYRVWYAAAPDSMSSRDATQGMNISEDNMAFYICPSDVTERPHACMSEEGKKSYCLSGDYNDNADWVFE